MSKNIRIRTNLNGNDNHLKVQLNQDFDFLEVLSLKISQEDVYRNFYSDYGVIVGRVIMNSGVGVPNAKVSIFIPLSDDDAEKPKISNIYPYKDLQDVDVNGVRYNTLPKNSQGVCHTPIGTFPTKREIIDNDDLLEVYEKYYKYSTTTNDAGDFMLFGVPVGNQILNVDVDLSDIGVFSQRPYDFIQQGNPEKLFESPTKFKSNSNLNTLTQIKNRQVGVNVIPFWGENQDNEVGISRVDVNLNYELQPKAIFIGSIFGDSDKESVNKNCRPSRKMGVTCEMTEGEGTIQMLRKNKYGNNERYDVEGGRVINEHGSWAYQIPMNLDYVVTDEFGNLVPTDDVSKGVPTKASVRFKIKLDETGGEGRLRTKANYLVPHNPNNVSEVDYNFDENTSDIHFRDIYWNKIYTVKNHISRFQKNSISENRNFIGLKDVDECPGNKNPIPYNKLDTKLNPLYIFLCIIMEFLVEAVSLINSIISIKLPLIGYIFGRKYCNKCIPINCDSKSYKPSCGDCELSTKSSLKDCLKITLAIALNIFKFDFYNDWLNGSLYAFLLKYKKNKNSDAKYCGNGNGDNGNNLINTNPEGSDTEKSQSIKIDEGVVVKFKDELFYKPITNNNYKFYATDIYNLGSVFSCDWQGINKIQPELENYSYKLPPITWDGDNDPNNDVTPLTPLLFSLDCFKTTTDSRQSTNIRRICEIGVGLDEDRITSDGQIISDDAIINRNDIDNLLIRQNLIKLNNDTFKNFDLSEINSEFEGAQYINYRGLSIKNNFEQFKNSFYFYFGTKPNNTALNLMNSKFFTDCTTFEESDLIVIGSVSNVTRNGSDGSITVRVIGGVAPYNYKWVNVLSLEEKVVKYDGLEGETINGLVEGVYSLTVTDKNDNSIVKTFKIDGYQEVEVDIIGRNASDITMKNGKIIINEIKGGLKPYDIKITGPIQTPLIFNDVEFNLDVENLGVGIYNVTISDSASPSDQINKTIQISTPEPLIVTVNETQPTCHQVYDGKISVTIQGGTPNYNIYLINSKGNYNYPILENGVYNFNNLVPEEYELNVIDNFNVTFTENITIIDRGELVLTFKFVPKLRPTDKPWVWEVTNTIEGVSYDLTNEADDVIESFIGNGGTYESTISSKIEGWQVISESGCISNQAEE